MKLQFCHMSASSRSQRSRIGRKARMRRSHYRRMSEKLPLKFGTVVSRSGIERLTPESNSRFKTAPTRCCSATSQPAGAKPKSGTNTKKLRWRFRRRKRQLANTHPAQLPKSSIDPNIRVCSIVVSPRQRDKFAQGHKFNQKRRRGRGRTARRSAARDPSPRAHHG